MLSAVKTIPIVLCHLRLLFNSREDTYCLPSAAMVLNLAIVRIKFSLNLKAASVLFSAL